MPFIDEFGDEWERETEHVGAWLKLSCPAGTVVSYLIQSGGGDITYRVEGSGGLQLPWPPDPTDNHYGERCPCHECLGRLVGATVDELQAEVNAIHNAPTVNEDTYVLRYLESARDMIEREAQNERYAFQRHIPTLTDTYVCPTWRVNVRYDGSFQGEVADVTVEPPTESYPPTLLGALHALRGSGS